MTIERCGKYKVEVLDKKFRILERERIGGNDFWFDLDIDFAGYVEVMEYLGKLQEE